MHKLTKYRHTRHEVQPVTLSSSASRATTASSSPDDTGAAAALGSVSMRTPDCGSKRGTSTSAADRATYSLTTTHTCEDFTAQQHRRSRCVRLKRGTSTSAADRATYSTTTTHVGERSPYIDAAGPSLAELRLLPHRVASLSLTPGNLTYSYAADHNRMVSLNLSTSASYHCRRTRDITTART